MIIPIFLFQNREPDRCPECGRLEDVKVLCRHCKYEYPESESKWTDWAVPLGSILGFIWLMFTVMFWTLESRSTTFVDMVVGQFEFVRDLLGRIW